MQEIFSISLDKIEILSKDNDTAIEQILFSGTIECVELVEEGVYAVLIINAISHTWKMDIQKRSRSFQNTSITYREMAQAVTQEYGASLIWNVSDKPLENPIIQYKETDYQFLQRICSHLQEGITAGDFSSKICIYAGLREGDNMGNIALEQYSYSVKIFKDQNTDKKRKKANMIQLLEDHCAAKTPASEITGQQQNRQT